LYVAYNAVHSPLQGADKYMEKFSHIEDVHRRIFAAMLANLDDSVGAVLDSVNKNDLNEETLIFFLSDNGGPTRELTSSNLPLRGEKSHMYEGGIRIPFMVKWNGVIPAGKVYEQPISSLDIYATAAQLAGAEINHQIDGVDLMPYITGSDKTSPHNEFFWRQGKRTALRYKDWKLVSMQRHLQKPVWELYDLSKDISEEHDLANQIPEKLQELIERWEKLNSQMSEPLF